MTRAEWDSLFPKRKHGFIHLLSGLKVKCPAGRRARTSEHITQGRTEDTRSLLGAGDPDRLVLNLGLTPVSGLE